MSFETLDSVDQQTMDLV